MGSRRRGAEGSIIGRHREVAMGALAGVVGCSVDGAGRGAAKRAMTRTSLAALMVAFPGVLALPRGKLGRVAR
jgi:hypothetical protein